MNRRIPQTLLRALPPIFLTGTLWAAPQLLCDPQDYNFGERESGEKVEAVFRLRNTGDGQLRIRGIRADCGCTTTIMPLTELDPGAETTLTAELSLKGRSGPQSKTITVESNDPEQPTARLTITGIAVRHFAVFPETLFLGMVPAGEPLERTVELCAEDQRPFRVIEVAATDTRLGVRVAREEGRLRYHVLVSIPDDWPAGTLRETLRVRTDHPSAALVEVPISGIVREMDQENADQL